MRIQTFKNKKGLIYGEDASHITCDKDGELRIGSTVVLIYAGRESIFPTLPNGDYKAIFTTTDGNVYELERVSVRAGRVLQPPETTLELMALRIRLDDIETVCDTLIAKVRELDNIFDTNALNFLIK